MFLRFDKSLRNLLNCDWQTALEISSLEHFTEGSFTKTKFRAELIITDFDFGLIIEIHNNKKANANCYYRMR